MRHSDGEIMWFGGRQNLTTCALDENGARYTIDRWVESWVISFLPFGTAENGRQPVPWLSDRKSLTTAKEAVEEHNRLRLS